MQGFRKLGSTGQNRGISPFAVIACLSLALSGCASFWDDVTSRNFDVRTYFEKPNPFVVLQNSNDGNERARALRALREPSQYGEAPQDQEAVLKILSTAASKERQFLCRMAAIESLGHCKDPRAVNGLTEAFYSSGTFAPDLATRMQTQAAISLGETRQPQALQFLIRLVQEKPRGEGSDLDKQQIMDVRIAAARALANYNDGTAIAALQEVLKTEKDVALRNSAQDSLEIAGGTRKPLVDFKALENLILPASAKKTN